jgi:hypothetical protein
MYEYKVEPEYTSALTTCHQALGVPTITVAVDVQLPPSFIFTLTPISATPILFPETLVEYDAALSVVGLTLTIEELFDKKLAEIIFPDVTFIDAVNS